MAPCRRPFARVIVKISCRHSINCCGHNLASNWSGSREGEAGSRRKQRRRLESFAGGSLAAASPPGDPAASMWIRARNTRSREMRSARVSRSARRSIASAPRRADRRPDRPREIGRTAIDHPATGHPATDHAAIVRPQTDRSASDHPGRSNAITGRLAEMTGHRRVPGSRQAPVRLDRRAPGQKARGNPKDHGSPEARGSRVDRRGRRAVLDICYLPNNLGLGDRLIGHRPELGD
jgi:hypothetical protein